MHTFPIPGMRDHTDIKRIIRNYFNLVKANKIEVITPQLAGNLCTDYT